MRAEVKQSRESIYLPQVLRERSLLLLSSSELTLVSARKCPTLPSPRQHPFYR